MIKCLRCGLCCVKANGKTCKYLIEYEDYKTKCKIYNSRLKTNIGDGEVCSLRSFQKRIIPGCPYNNIIKERFGINGE